MRIDLDAIEVIDTILECGSFAKAAEKLHKVRSALTYTVNKFEEDLGVQIFDRSGHKAILTPAGVEILKQGRVILEQTRNLASRAKAIVAGWEDKIVISYNDLIPIDCLLPIVKEFQEACPYTELTLIAERLNGTIESVVSGDAVLCIGASRDLPEGADYANFPMPSLEFVFAISPDHPLNKIQGDLSNEDILRYPSVAATDTAQYVGRTVGVLPGQKLLRVNSIQAKKAAQIAGAGVGFLPRAFVQKEIASGELVVKTVAKPKPELPMMIVWRTKSMGKALTWLVERLRNEKYIWN